MSSQNGCVIEKRNSKYSYKYTRKYTCDIIILFQSDVCPRTDTFFYGSRPNYFGFPLLRHHRSLNRKKERKTERKKKERRKERREKGGRTEERALSPRSKFHERIN